ncbi:MAG: lysylphosphatidylglycerol synthase transmembrane domain-containing protein, partial [Nanoarchaeota archaeon]
LGFFKTLKYFLRSFSLGLFVPAKLGEVSFIYFLNKEGIEVGKASAIFVIDKLVTLITLLLVGVVGIIILFNGEQRISVMAFLGISVSVGLFFIMSNFGRGLVKRFILRKYSDVFAGFSKTFFYYLKEKTNVVILNFFLSIIRWTFGAMSVYIMFLSLNYEPKFFYVWIIKPLTIIVSLIPITIAGLGVREGSAIFLFGIINIPPNITASVYFTFTAINYLLAGILIVYFLNKK